MKRTLPVGKFSPLPQLAALHISDVQCENGDPSTYGDSNCLVADLWFETL